MNTMFLWIPISLRLAQPTSRQERSYSYGNLELTIFFSRGATPMTRCYIVITVSVAELCWQRWRTQRDSGVVAQSSNVNFVLTASHVIGSQAVNCSRNVMILNIAQTNLFEKNTFKCKLNEGFNLFQFTCRLSVKPNPAVVTIPANSPLR